MLPHQTQFPLHYLFPDTAKKSSSNSSSGGKKKKKKAKSSSSEEDASSIPTSLTDSKEKKSLQTPASAITKVQTSTTQHKDNSQAILSASKAAANSLSVFLYDANDGHSVVGMTESAMEHLGIFDGDTVSIKGKRGRKTMATVAMILDSDVSALDASIIATKKTDRKSSSSGDDVTFYGAIGMTQDAMKNAGVRSGDKVIVSSASDVNTEIRKVENNFVSKPDENTYLSKSLLCSIFCVLYLFHHNNHLLVSFWYYYHLLGPGRLMIVTFAWSMAL